MLTRLIQSTPALRAVHAATVTLTVIHAKRTRRVARYAIIGSHGTALVVMGYHSPIEIAMVSAVLLAELATCD